jgi:hypothetical protein
MLPNATVMTHPDGRGVDEADPGAVPIATSQVGTQRHQYRWHEFHKPVVADQVRKLRAQIDLHKLRVVGLEIAVTHLMKVNHDRHDLAWTQLTGSSTALYTRLQQFSLPFWTKSQPEIIDMAEQFQ